MSNNVKNVIRRTVLGFPVGVFISATIALSIALFGNVTMYSDIGFYVKSYFAGGALGVLFTTSSMIFDNENWSLLKRSIVHFIITIPTLMGIALWSGWVDNVLAYLISAIVVYAVFYLIFFFIEKSRVEKINSMLNENFKS